MLKIGEVAKQFNISNRTLRYWEEVGILESSRMENGYRFYDNENADRIRQIVLLRRLKISIADIEQIFLTADLNVARDALNNHLESLKKDNAESKSLIVLIEDLIRFISKQRSLKPVFSYIETLETTTDLESKEVLKFQLSERGIFMSTEKLGNVRIVKLPAMTVASYRAESSTPEDDCSKVFNQFVLKNNLHKRDGFRFFGFNNPSPSEGNPVYGYEMWVTISNDFEVPQPLVKKHFGGGLYASISTQMNEIGERWKHLYDWSKNNDKYDVDFSFQWLEECSMDFETFISEKVKDSEKQLDLLEPIKLK
jgi:DNA-binding transcriptional MerR regulator/DNA gyrase inhibitor GyrI